MASFKFSKKELESLEKSISFCEVNDIPLNLTNKIGEGSFATIFKYNIRKKPAALKVLRQNISKKKLLETSIKLRNLKHENVVRFRGYSIKPSVIIFELCELVVESDIIVNNLTELVNIFNENNHFNLSERLELILQSARGLKYLHNKEILHKDFKPTNCLVTGTLSNIVVKVADFDGIVDIKNTISSTKTIFKSNRLLGMTMSFIAPEIILGSHVSSKESDVYSWALSSFEVLGNVDGVPWKGVFPIFTDAMLMKSLHDSLRPRIDDLKELYSDEILTCITDIITTCWHTNPNFRFDINKVINSFFDNLNLY